MKKTLVCLLSILVFNLANSQIDSSAVLTVGGTVNGVLTALSIEEDEKQNWEQFEFLFLPDADLSVVYQIESSNDKSYKEFTVDEFINAMTEANFTNGFEEVELGTVINEYNGIAQVFQGYKVREGQREEMGVNSYQLIHDGQRWWIKSVIWASNSNGIEVPAEYVTGDR